MNSFFKDFDVGADFSGKTFLESKKTVCVKYKDGHVSEHKDISDPWKYIMSVKKNVEVESVWIKNE